MNRREKHLDITSILSVSPPQLSLPTSTAGKDLLSFFFLKRMQLDEGCVCASHSSTGNPLEANN